MREIFIATTNQGKLGDFTAAAAQFRVRVLSVPQISTLPPAREDAPTFEANACKKAEYYSRAAKGRYVLADDSGLEVDALAGAPGVRSARYAADANRSAPSQQAKIGVAGDTGEHIAGGPAPNSIDSANNARLLAELSDVPSERRTARFVCAIAVARDGRLVVCFRGEVRGLIALEPRGHGGFGYDPLFYLPTAGCTLAELSPEQKAELSHRGQAFRKFLNWYTSPDWDAEQSALSNRQSAEY